MITVSLVSWWHVVILLPDTDEFQNCILFANYLQPYRYRYLKTGSRVLLFLQVLPDKFNPILLFDFIQQNVGLKPFLVNRSFICPA